MAASITPRSLTSSQASSTTARRTSITLRTVLARPHPCHPLSARPDLNPAYTPLRGAVRPRQHGSGPPADADLVGALLAWEPTVDVDDLADRAGIGRDRASTALARLGTAGQVGYDVAEAAYFHRILPYDTARVQRHNPRLVDALALVEAGGVTVEGPVATVRSGAEVYRVRHVDGHSTCTCPWWGKYQGERGPCKHALAVDIATRAAREAAHQVQS
jgi:hypothetical protein